MTERRRYYYGRPAGATGQPARVLSAVQFIEQRFSVLQVGGVEALGEPAVDVGEHRARFVARPCVASSRARLVVARSSQAFALIFCASAIASRKSASASSLWPSLSRSSPRADRNWPGRPVPRGSPAGASSIVIRASSDRCRPRPGPRPNAVSLSVMVSLTPASTEPATPLADKRNAFTRAAELRPRPAEHH